MNKNILMLACLLCVFVAGTIPTVAEETGSAARPEASQGMVSAYEQKKPEWFKVSFLDVADDVQEAADAGKHYGMYFYQDGCPYCEKLIDDNFSQYRINEYAKNNFDIVAINIFGSLEVTDVDGVGRPESAFSKHRNIQFTPTMIFFAPSGEVFRMNGYYPPHKFLAMLEYIHEKKYLGDTSFIDFMFEKNTSPVADKMHYTPEMLRAPADFPTQRAGKKRPLLVLFEQPRCLACDELHLDILKREKTQKLFKQFDVALINVHGKEKIVSPAGAKLSEKDWAQSLGIEYTPSLVFFKQGSGDKLAEVFRTEGYMKSFHIQSAMAYVLSGSYINQKDFQAFLRHRADKIREKEGHLDIMQ